MLSHKPQLSYEHCAQCGRQLDVPNDLASRNRGGDCLSCMAASCDQECIQAKWQIENQKADFGLTNKTSR